ncbi:MAG: N utilization substance protein B [Candidatus Dichloromethanomonas elyunquensis]|nr:MAG: N utilization substance protein B [Candidatus Dichloromethanomonas elyunquensis]
MSRRLARETALQVLYQIDITGETQNIQEIIQNWAAEFNVSAKNMGFTQQLVIGTIEKREDIDQKISRTAHEWALDRMNTVDRNLMRLAIYEMNYCPETPQKVTLNEAIEIAKRFGGEDSARFINGILDKVMDASEKLEKEHKGNGE